MKKNKAPSIKKSIKKIGDYSKNNFISSLKLAKLKFKESLKSGSFILRISKEERYKKIIEKINHIKKLGIPSKKDKKSNNITTEFQLKKLSNKLFQVFEGIEIFKFLKSKLKLTSNKTNKKY